MRLEEAHCNTVIFHLFVYFFLYFLAAFSYSCMFVYYLFLYSFILIIHYLTLLIPLPSGARRPQGPHTLADGGWTGRFVAGHSLLQAWPHEGRGWRDGRRRGRRGWRRQQEGRDKEEEDVCPSFRPAGEPAHHQETDPVPSVLLQPHLLLQVGVLTWHIIISSNSSICFSFFSLAFSFLPRDPMFVLFYFLIVVSMNCLTTLFFFSFLIAISRSDVLFFLVHSLSYYIFVFSRRRPFISFWLFSFSLIDVQSLIFSRFFYLFPFFVSLFVCYLSSNCLYVKRFCFISPVKLCSSSFAC